MKKSFRQKKQKVLMWWNVNREKVAAWAAVTSILLGFILIIVYSTAYSRSSLLSIGIALIPVALSFSGIRLAWKSSRQSETILQETKTTQTILRTVDVTSGVYPLALDVEEDEQDILALDCISGLHKDIKVMIFFPQMESDDVITVTLRMQEPRPNQQIVWSKKDIIVKGPRHEPEFEVYTVGDCVTQVKVGLRANARGGRKLAVRAYWIYTS
ncbi:hypothetical protein ACFLXE_00810 [Chloroflexota bacterium]